MTSPFTILLTAIARIELAFWQNHTEGNAQVRPRLEAYYRACGFNARRARNLARQAANDDTAWSAAFISYLFQTAGAGAAFPSALAHSQYVTALKGNIGSNADFQAWPLGGIPAAVGDVICVWRDADPDTSGVQRPRIHGKPVSYGAIDPNDYRFFTSHCDLIVDIQGNDVTAIGGNVGNTVAETRYNRSMIGFIRHPRGVALIKNFR